MDGGFPLPAFIHVPHFILGGQVTIAGVSLSFLAPSPGENPNGFARFSRPAQAGPSKAPPILSPSDSEPFRLVVPTLGHPGTPWLPLLFLLDQFHLFLKASPAPSHSNGLRNTCIHLV